MAKKDKNKVQESTIENYYDLKVDKVDELVAALKGDDTGDGSEVNYGMNTNMGVNDAGNLTRSGKEKQFDPYKTDFLSRIPAWIKALFVKFWFAGAVCLFIMWGIGVQDEDAVLLMGIVMGLIVDILVNPLFRYMETDRREYNAYMMFPFPFRAIWTFFANIFYYILVLIVVNLSYFGINQLINLINSTQEVYYIGVEPLLFGVFAVIIDMAFIGIKDLIVFLVKKSKKKELVADV